LGEERMTEQTDDPFAQVVAGISSSGRTRERRNEMKKTLFTPAAMAVVSLAVGFGGIAAAQSRSRPVTFLFAIKEDHDRRRKSCVDLLAN
jgi:hypothetical protein